jgi:hypothetical protein
MKGDAKQLTLLVQTTRLIWRKYQGNLILKHMKILAIKYAARHVCTPLLSILLFILFINNNAALLVKKYGKEVR